MAIKSRRECGEQMSNDAKTCPKCGMTHPVNNPMKNWLWIVAALIVVITIGSCESNEQIKADQAKELALHFIAVRLKVEQNQLVAGIG